MKPEAPEWSPSDKPKIDPKTDRRVQGESLRRQIGAALCYMAQKQTCPVRLLDDFEVWQKAGCDYRKILTIAQWYVSHWRSPKGEPGTESERATAKTASHAKRLRKAAAIVREYLAHSLFSPWREEYKELPQQIDGFADRLEELAAAAHSVGKGWRTDLGCNLVEYLRENKVQSYYPGLTRLLNYLDVPVSSAALKMACHNKRARKARSNSEAKAR